MSAPSPLLYHGACAAAFLAAAFAGWSLTGSVSSKSPADSPHGSETGQEIGKRSERAEHSNGVPAHVRETMAAIRTSSPEQRMRATIDLASNMPLSDLAEWLEKRWFDTGEGFDLTLFHKIAMQRWEAEDREGFIAWSVKNNPDGASQLLADWAKKEPALALAFLKTHPDPRLEMWTLSALASTEPKLALEHLTEMLKRGNNQQVRNYFDDDLFRNVAAKDPAALEAALDSLPYGWQLRAEGALVGERLKASFSDELKQLLARDDGWKLFQAASGSTREIRDRLIDELPNLPDSWKHGIFNEIYRFINQDNASKWLDMDLDAMGLNDNQKNHLRQSAIQNLAFKNPSEALGLLDQFGLEEYARRNLISNIIANHPTMAQDKGEKLIAALQNEEDRELARKILSTRQDEDGNPRGPITKPSDWLEQVSNAEAGHGTSHLYSLRGWDKEKITALSEGFQNMPADKKLGIAKVLASGSDYGIDSTLQGDAIRYLVSQPPPSKEEGDDGSNGAPSRRSADINPSQVASRYAVDLSTKDPDAAARWVQSLPAGEARQWANKNLATNWANYDPEGMREWMNSLPPKEQADVEAHLKEQAK